MKSGDVIAECGLPGKHQDVIICIVSTVLGGVVSAFLCRVPSLHHNAAFTV